MVKKKIRKFFNSVSVCDCMPMMFEEQKKKHFSFLWVALGAACTLCAAVAEPLGVVSGDNYRLGRRGSPVVVGKYLLDCG